MCMCTLLAPPRHSAIFAVCMVRKTTAWGGTPSTPRMSSYLNPRDHPTIIGRELRLMGDRCIRRISARRRRDADRVGYRRGAQVGGEKQGRAVIRWERRAVVGHVADVYEQRRRGTPGPAV